MPLFCISQSFKAARSVVPPPPPPPPSTAQYFTSTLYPMVLSEQTLTIGSVAVVGGAETNSFNPIVDDVARIMSPEIIGGTLETTINFFTIDNSSEDSVYLEAPSLVEGTLESVIAYKVIDASHDETNDIYISSPQVLTGTLDVVISYLNYEPSISDKLNISNPTIISGSLT